MAENARTDAPGSESPGSDTKEAGQAGGTNAGQEGSGQDTAVASKDDGGGDWRASLPESVRDWDEFKSSDTPEKAFERIGHMRSKFGTGLFPPGEDASTEDWAAFYGKLSERTQGKVMPRPSDEDAEATNALYKSLGVPETADEYQIQGDDADLNARIGQIALEHKLSKSQLEGVDKAFAGIAKEQAEAKEANRLAAMDTLKGEWGAAWGERSKIADKVRETFLSFIPADQMNPQTMTALFEIGRALGGEGAQLLNQETSVSEPTVMEARDQIGELTKRIFELNKDGKNRDEVKRLTAKRRDLYKKANPGGGKSVVIDQQGRSAGRGGVTFE